MFVCNRDVPILCNCHIASIQWHQQQFCHLLNSFCRILHQQFFNFSYFFNSGPRQSWSRTVSFLFCRKKFWCSVLIWWHLLLALLVYSSYYRVSSLNMFVSSWIPSIFWQLITSASSVWIVCVKDVSGFFSDKRIVE